MSQIEISELARENAKKAERLNPYERAKRNPTSMRYAINAMCYGCIGENADPNWQRRVRDCEITDCPLYSFRPHQKLGAAKKMDCDPV